MTPGSPAAEAANLKLVQRWFESTSGDQLAEEARRGR